MRLLQQFIILYKLEYSIYLLLTNELDILSGTKWVEFILFYEKHLAK